MYGTNAKVPTSLDERQPVDGAEAGVPGVDRLGRAQRDDADHFPRTIVKVTDPAKYGINVSNYFV